MVQHLASKGIRLMVSAWPYVLKSGARASENITKPGNAVRFANGSLTPWPDAVCDSECYLYPLPCCLFRFQRASAQIYRRRCLSRSMKALKCLRLSILSGYSHTIFTLAAEPATHQLRLIRSYGDGQPDGKAECMHKPNTCVRRYDPTHDSGRAFVWEMLNSGYVKYGVKNFWFDASEPESLANFNRYGIDYQNPLGQPRGSTFAAGTNQQVGMMFPWCEQPAHSGRYLPAI